MEVDASARVDVWPAPDTKTRVMSACEEYPVAYCYVTETQRKVAREGHFRAPLSNCFTDAFLCRRELASVSGSAGTDCFPAGNPADNIE